MEHIRNILISKMSLSVITVKLLACFCISKNQFLENLSTYLVEPNRYKNLCSKYHNSIHSDHAKYLVIYELFTSFFHEIKCKVAVLNTKTLDIWLLQLGSQNAKEWVTVFSRLKATNLISYLWAVHLIFSRNQDFNNLLIKFI